MSDFTNHLSGAVRKQSLPIFTDPTKVAASARKRLRLPQGELTQIYNEPEGMRYLAFIELTVGSPRGNHYHENKEEWIYLIQGKLRLTVQNVQNLDRTIIECEAGDLVVISPGIAHALHATEAGMALEFSPQQFDPADVKRYALA